MAHNVIIQSIGTASPSASKVLSEALKVPHDYILKILYNAPSLLFQKVDKETALKAEKTLNQLGLEVGIFDEKEKFDFTTEKVDVSVSIDDILKLPKVVDQLSDFLGCKPSETLNLLLNEPSIVIGNISPVTAKALGKRLDAKVHFSSPKNDQYLIFINKKTDKVVVNEIEKLLKKKFSETENAFFLEDISYDESQNIWRRFKNTKDLKIVNQSHQLVHVVLNEFDLENEVHTSFLKEVVGMPEEILKDIHRALPITLYEHINRKEAFQILMKCKEINLNASIENDFERVKKIKISDVELTEEIVNVLSQFISPTELPKVGEQQWISNKEIPSLLARYIQAQLNSLSCESEIV